MLLPTRLRLPPPRPALPAPAPAGTPLQNDLAELQNLLHFLLPSVFAAQGFEDLAEMLQVGGSGWGLQRGAQRGWAARGLQAGAIGSAAPVDKRPAASSTLLALPLALPSSPRASPLSPLSPRSPLRPRPCQGDDEEIAKLTERMKQLLGPFVLRRLKTEVAGQLTDKTHKTGAPAAAAPVLMLLGWGLALNCWCGGGGGSGGAARRPPRQPTAPSSYPPLPPTPRSPPQSSWT